MKIFLKFEIPTGIWSEKTNMPYVFVRENSIKYWCTIQGLNHNEVLRITSHPSLEIFCCKDFYSNGTWAKEIFFVRTKTYSKGKILSFFGLKCKLSNQIWNTTFIFPPTRLQYEPCYLKKNTSEFQLENQILNWIYSLFNVFLILFEKKKIAN